VPSLVSLVSTMSPTNLLSLVSRLSPTNLLSLVSLMSLHRELLKVRTYRESHKGNVLVVGGKLL
jgi:hypothetical protein